MSEDIKLKKYFIKDEELTSINEDKLSSKDVMKNIATIIDNTKPPYAIALTGKSGIGKSSIINLLEENYRENENYVVRKINVWKQEKSLKEILNCSVNQDMNNNYIVAGNQGYTSNTERNNQSVSEQFVENHSASQKSGKLKILAKVGKFVLTFLISLLITTIIFILMEYMGNRAIYNANDIFFVENTYLNYRENFLTIMVFTIGLTAIAYIINTLRIATKKSSNNSKSNIDVNHNNNVAIETQNANNQEIISNNQTATNNEININPSKTNIIIIEDVDKLPAGQMLKSLEDVKHAADYPNCIIIVPFDENVLAKAIEVRNQIKLSANYRPLKFEKILEKVFQFKVYVPHIANGNIKDYAVELAKECAPNFIEEYCQMPLFERVIRHVLIYKNVNTPRHVKKLINNFINNKMLISNRIASGNIKQETIENNNFDYQLAKISVIQSDFEEFYDVLFKDFDYLEALTEFYTMDIDELRNIYENIDDDLKPFFTEKYRPLMNFLAQTQNCKVDNMSILMYLTKVKVEKMFKDKTVFGYLSGEEDVSELRIQEVLELVKMLEDSDEIKEFTVNNFDKLFEKYKANSSNKVYFTGFSEIVNITNKYIDEVKYIEYLEVVANNYNYYPQEALQVFENVNIDIPTKIMNIIIEKIKDSISKENYDETFNFLKDNSDALYEEDGNLSEYVHFLVDYINLSSNPTEVIEELDTNFTRIGKIYELNQNIQGLENLDYDKAYIFIAKCLDNGDFDRLVSVVNKILSNDNSVQNCLDIEEKMKNYNLIDVIECNVDDIKNLEETKLESVDKEQKAEENANQKSEESDDSNDDENLSSIENAKFLESNYKLLKNIIELCAIKQTEIAPIDTLKIIEKALENNNDSEYILSIYELLNKFDRMYFYEIRRDFNEVIYGNFHETKADEVKKAALECTRFFRNTRLFLTKINDEEKKFYEAN